MRFRPLVLLAGLLVVASLAGRSTAEDRVTRVAAVNTTKGIALKGYDPVAYFTAGRPTPGTDEYVYPLNGVQYRFSSAENLKRFAADPERYLPQYGGYCAYAISINRIADIDPTEWAVVDDKLYLNNNALSQTLWSLNRRSRIEAGDRNWAAVPKTAAKSTETELRLP